MISTTVAISTINSRILDILLPERDDSIDYLVVHQRVSGHVDENCYLQFEDRRDVEVITISEIGLSKSRNTAIMMAKGRYIHFMDDDVQIDVQGIKKLSIEMSHMGCAIATGRFCTVSGKFPKKYRDFSFRHTYFTAAKVSSIEISIDRHQILKNKLSFDTSFGLGSKMPSGEEFIFITDALKLRLEVFYFPHSVGIHPDISSGDDFYSTQSKVVAKREMLGRVFGRYKMVFTFLFWFKKLNMLSSFKEFVFFTRYMFFK